MSNAQQAYQWLISQGYPSHAAAGMVGNLIQESGVNPNVRPGDNGSAHGIAQWRFDRYQGPNGLLGFAQRNNANPNDLTTQLQFLNWELKNRYSNVYSQLMNSKNVRDATAAMVLGYERPAGAQTGVAENTDGWQNRLRQALNVAGGGGGSEQGPMAAAPQGGEQAPQKADFNLGPAPTPPPDEPMAQVSYGGIPGSDDSTYRPGETGAGYAPEMAATDTGGGLLAAKLQQAALNKKMGMTPEVAAPLGNLFEGAGNDMQKIGLAGQQQDAPRGRG